MKLSGWKWPGSEVDSVDFDPNAPKYLYKYMGESLFEFFENCGLRFTQRSSFNDPFEQLKVDRQKLERLDADQRQALLADCANVYAHSKTLVANIFQKKMELEKSSLSTDVSDYTNGAGLLCLSEVPDSLLMWSHYASEHRGFVIEINAEYFWKNQLYKNDGKFIVRRVLYRDARVDDQQLGLHEYLFDTPHQTISTKSSHWSYEHEWRIEAPLGDGLCFVLKDGDGEANKIDKSKNPYYLHKIPEQYITKIIFGANCRMQDILRVKNKLETNRSLSHVLMKLAVLDPTDFRLRLVNIKHSDFGGISESCYAP